uniref:Homeobox domain-containing protein n=1 Tax=Rhabditophanes sp. KR3021 TaxID=114890 RepID=A0AC35TK71_9BILA
MQFLNVAVIFISFFVFTVLAADPPVVVPTTTTMGSTTADPNSCTDLAANCAAIASFCMNSNYASTMLANCRKCCKQLSLRSEDKRLLKRRAPRTTIKQNQLDVLNDSFQKNPKPSKHDRAKLSLEAGLSMRVIQPISRSVSLDKRINKVGTSINTLNSLIQVVERTRLGGTSLSSKNLSSDGDSDEEAEYKITIETLQKLRRFDPIWFAKVCQTSPETLIDTKQYEQYQRTDYAESVQKTITCKFRNKNKEIKNMQTSHKAFN